MFPVASACVPGNQKDETSDKHDTGNIKSN